MGSASIKAVRRMLMKLTKELPNASSFYTMVEYDNSLIILYENAMYQLSSPVGPWVEMKQKLEIMLQPKIVSFLVPDEIVNCH